MDKHKNGFFITINTNSIDTKHAHRLKAIWKHICSNLVDFTFSKTPGHIFKVKESHIIEVGDKYHQVHLHAQIEITAQVPVFLNYSKIPQFVNFQLSRFPNFDACKFDSEFISNLNASRKIKEYMEKKPLLYDDEPFELIL